MAHVSPDASSDMPGTADRSDIPSRGGNNAISLAFPSSWPLHPPRWDVRHAVAEWGWAAMPFATAACVRVALFMLASFAGRMLSPAIYAGWLGSWDRYDSVWYISIASQGYGYTGAGASNVNFFPLFPTAIWLVEHVTRYLSPNHSYLLAGMAVSWLAFAGACVVLYRLALERFGAEVARGAVLLLATFPFGYFFGAAYSESLYLFFVVLAFYGIERRYWLLACIAAMFCGAVRPPGLVVGACVALAYALDWLRTRHGWRWDVLWIALTPLGTGAYLFYCWLRFGNALAYVTASADGWQAGHVQPTMLYQIAHLLRHPHLWVHGTDFNTTLWGLYAVLVLLFVLALVPIGRILGLPYALYTFASIAAPIATFPMMTSLGRYLSVAFPVFLVTAYLLRRAPGLRDGLALGGAAALGVFTVMFTLSYPVF